MPGCRPPSNRRSGKEGFGRALHQRPEGNSRQTCGNSAAHTRQTEHAVRLLPSLHFPEFPCTRVSMAVRLRRAASFAFPFSLRHRSRSTCTFSRHIPIAVISSTRTSFLASGSIARYHPFSPSPHSPEIRRTRRTISVFPQDESPLSGWGRFPASAPSGDGNSASHRGWNPLRKSSPFPVSRSEIPGIF